MKKDRTMNLPSEWLDAKYIDRYHWIKSVGLQFNIYSSKSVINVISEIIRYYNNG